MRALICVFATLFSLHVHAFDTPQEFEAFVSPPHRARGLPVPDKAQFDAIRRTGSAWAPAPAQAASQAMLAAARARDWDAVLARLKDGADPNVVDAQRRGGVLALAAADGRAELVRKLLAAGADPDRRGEAGFTPLGVAALRGHAAVVRLLLRHGADPDKRGADGAPPLVNAVRLGHRHIVDTLLAAGADPSLPDKRGLHALGMAAAGGDAGLVRAVLATGMNVDTPDGEGRTAYFWAGVYRHPAVRALLLAAGADATASVRVR
ncbi:ankyrin repeat domain-containing protein [Nitrogeniibacter mangrovi]|uniref:Ankyrin repeat domain-containing protein n=1 Tax=Nitrogeniibacter mangrovi TaxID=2016596 RepID=A0A6C1AZY1_9RHOO|nr:ankyrin repeat domain-containing protein [Nitrogeniibacter mangrovi]QID16205.1 ankyrin repeat domain-containing protein [Nitrogeniibacter mangrovi]